MEKGGGCVPSKKKKPSSPAAADGPGTDDAPIPIKDDQTTTGTTTLGEDDLSATQDLRGVLLDLFRLLDC
ncbi:hypothetical protein Bca52824_015413 [Brassica carinata]|uniref:Uncharacterized protein n=1 Tax=Brassica carinata TaxID=52824 RepID=A0A8X7W4K7_BRACI|nr:hypothetical protein Bca52824_015413 [Brassica carinata]